LHTRHTEIIWLKVSNENLPCEHLCGGNKSIISQLNILQFGTISNTTELYTTVFESNDQVGIWKLEFLTDGNGLERILSKEVLKQLRDCAAVVGERRLRFPVDRIGTHSIRAGAAIAMFLAGVPCETIQLIASQRGKK
jgi:hypothetical protein